MSPLVAVKHFCGRRMRNVPKLLECMCLLDQLGSTQLCRSNLPGHLGSLKDDRVSGDKREGWKRSLQFPAHDKLAAGQQVPGPHVAPAGQHWVPPGQSSNPASTHCCLWTRPLTALRTGTSATWRVRGIIGRVPLEVRRRMAMGPSYRFKRKDKSLPSSARRGVGEFAREIAGSRNAEMSRVNFIVFGREQVDKFAGRWRRETVVCTQGTRRYCFSLTLIGPGESGESGVH